MVDAVLSYCHYSLNDSSLESAVPYLESKGVGIINASLLSMGLLTEQVCLRGCLRRPRAACMRTCESSIQTHQSTARCFPLWRAHVVAAELQCALASRGLHHGTQLQMRSKQLAGEQQSMLKRMALTSRSWQSNGPCKRRASHHIS